MLDIELVITDIVVLTEDQEFLKRYPENHELIEASSPDVLSEFMSINEHFFAGADAVLYMSKLMYAMPNEGAPGYTKAKGLAYGGATCTSFSGALISDDGKMNGVSTAAHELLHLLGSTHDGQPPLEYIPGSPGAEACKDDRQYIMASQEPAPLQPPLSNCTRDQVLAFLRTQDGECLGNAEPRQSPPISEAMLRKPLVNASNYCNYLHKDASAVIYMPAYSSDHNIGNCYLVCMTIDSSGAKEYNIHIAPDYTLCSETTKQVCLSGICRAIPPKGKPLHQKVKELANRRILMSHLEIDE
ncbi:uncharacterized protein [Dermacentor andersoni]|uniref:uncharacterized protein n=1 Tax=Dermacentor andersoni TaxID=34620 RepID=UPI002416358C|nr:A disintegrin and metalloproteinase with thrombospondin motifs 10-like [Dermacentor andersoni]